MLYFIVERNSTTCWNSPSVVKRERRMRVRDRRLNELAICGVLRNLARSEEAKGFAFFNPETATTMMNTPQRYALLKPWCILLGSAWLLVPSAGKAQVPPSLAGDGIGGLVTAGNGPFAPAGYFIVLPANSGANYQVIGIYGIADFNGTYSYSTSGAYGYVTMNSSGGTQVVRLEFINNWQGYFYQAAGPYYQEGNFEITSGQAPASVAGLSVYVNTQDGAPPFSANGTGVFKTTSATTYTIAVGGIPQNTGTYSYTKINNSTGSLQLNDSITGTSTLYIGYTSPVSGLYGIRQLSTGGFQIGDFTVLNTRAAITSPTSAATYQTSSNVISLAGTSSDNLGIAKVTWSNNRGGSGAAVGTNSWSVADIALQTGVNVITVTALDTVGNTAEATISVTYTAPPTLSIVRIKTNVVLSWPTNVAGYSVESATNFLVGGWNTNYPKPVIVAGRYTVTNALNRATKIYRLFK
jgi:hypothetical protein